MVYTEDDKTRMLGFPILTLLAIHGRRTDRRGPLHFSPFRDEKVGSFKIDTSRNLWYDHGEGCGGNVFTLAQRLLGIPDGRRSEVWDYLASLDPAVIPESRSESSVRQAETTSRIVVDSVSGDIPVAMYSYAASRGITGGLLSRYCRCVRFHIEGSPTGVEAIGFPNRRGGWVLRRATDRKGVPCLKRCTSSDVTLMGPDGTMTESPSHDEVVVLEGFFDFLSLLAWRRTAVPMRDVCVLNSVSNTPRAMEFILSHRRVVTLLDNDRAGREHTERIRRVAAAAGVTFRDDARLMGESKDMNEFLVRRTASGTKVGIHP